MTNNSTLTPNENTQEPAQTEGGISEEQAPFQFKGGLMPMTQLELFRYDYRSFNQRLARMVKQAPSFFRDMPVIINLERLKHEHESIDFIELSEVCQAYGVYPIAVRGGHEDQITAAFVAGLPQIPTNPTHKAFHQQRKNVEFAEYAPDNAPELDTPETEVIQRSERPPSKIVDHAVRSGQQVYASGGDLIVLGPVSAGAEILADGHIHVYGTLRGRALAGVKGDTTARIFCQKLEAELLSIAGHYKMDEDLQRVHWRKAIHATLDGKKLKIEAMNS
ncbi:MAG: septum site-determining protein MinC [Gammaproteobacteria bacterium]